MRYLADPSGGVLISGPGSVALARFCADFKKMRVRDFRLCGDDEAAAENAGENRPLRERYFAAISARGPAAADAFAGDFAALLEADADALLFVDNKFQTRTRDVSEAENRLTSALIKRMDDNDAKIYQK